MNRVVIIGCFLVVFSSCNLGKHSGSVEETGEYPERLERIKMTDMNGTPLDLADFAGRPVFLNFWATWCRPCIGEMASISELYGMYGDDVEFLAVTTESLEDIQKFQEQHNLPFTLARLDISYIEVFVVGLPTTLLIDKRGGLFYEEEGATIWTLENNLQRIRDLMEE